MSTMCIERHAEHAEFVKNADKVDLSASAVQDLRKLRGGAYRALSNSLQALPEDIHNVQDDHKSKVFPTALVLCRVVNIKASSLHDSVDNFSFRGRILHCRAWGRGTTKNAVPLISPLSA